MEKQIALLEWINTFNLPEDIKSLNELSDGHVFWDILRDVDPTYFTSSLPESRRNTTKWISRYENLKTLHKTLVSYISEECEQKLFALRVGEGLQAIAQDASELELIELFLLVLQATIRSPRKEQYIMRMVSLSSASMQILKGMIEDREAVEESDDQQDDAHATPLTFAADPGLELEERLGEIMAKNEHLKQENHELQDGMRNLDERLIRLQENNHVLQQRLTEAEDCLQNGVDFNDKDGRSTRDLESKIKQQENDFADQETRFAQQTRTSEALQKKIDNMEASLNSSTRKAQDARDELNEVRRERDTLTKKANMVDKLKQQLQTSNSLKGENDSLKKEANELRRELSALQHVRRDNLGLTTAVEEYKQLLPRIEEDNADLVRVRRQLELDNESLHKQHKQDQATITQLNRRVRSSSVSSIGSHDNENLESQVMELADAQSKAKEGTSNIKRQNEQLESIAQEQASKILSLQRLLEEANARPKQTNDIRRPSFTSPSPTKKPGSAPRFGVPTLTGIAQPAHGLISTETVQKLRAQLTDEEAKRKTVDSQLRKTVQELDLIKKDRRSLIHRYLNADEQHANHLAVAYVAMDKLEMVAQVKEDNSSELKQLQTEHTLLQEINDRLESENRTQKDILSKSLGQNASLQHNTELMQEVRDQIAAIKDGKSLDDASQDMDVYGKMIMEGRQTLVETQKVYREIVLPIIETQQSPVVSILPKKSAPSADSSWFKRSKITA